MTGPVTGGPTTARDALMEGFMPGLSSRDAGLHADKVLAELHERGFEIVRASRAAAEGDAGALRLRAALARIVALVEASPDGELFVDDPELEDARAALAAAPLPPAEPLDVERLTGQLRQAYTLLVSSEPTLIRDARTAPNETSAYYKAQLVAAVAEWVDQFRDDFDGGLARLATAATPAAGEPGE